MTSLPSFLAASTAFCHSASWAAAAWGSAALAARPPRTFLLSIAIPSLSLLKRADELLDEAELHPAEHQHEHEHQQTDDAYLLGLAASPHLQHYHRKHLGAGRIEQ